MAQPARLSTCAEAIAALVLGSTMPVQAAMQWQRLDAGTDNFIRDIQFLDRATGYICTSWGSVCMTTDAGDHWTQLPSGTDANLWDLCFVDRLHGWVVGGDAYTTTEGTVIRTKDGGQTWQSLPNVLTPCISSVWFVDTLHGWCSFTSAVYPCGILKTSDGGDSWVVVNCTPMDGPLTTLQFADTATGWGVGADTRIVKTTDGGMTWRSTYSGSSRGCLEGLHFVDALHGWAVGGSTNGWDVILATTDGGENWSTQYTGSTMGWLGVHFVDAEWGWAVGESGVLLHTEDGGANWSGTQKWPTWLCVYFFDRTIGWAGGTFGVLYRAVDSSIILPTDGRIEVTLTKASATLVSDVYLRAPDTVLLIENNLTNVGIVVDTTYRRGTAIVLGIVVHGPGGDYEHLSTSQYAQVTRLADTLWEVAFEDLPDSLADWDFDDVIIRVRLDRGEEIVGVRPGGGRAEGSRASQAAASTMGRAEQYDLLGRPGPGQRHGAGVAMVRAASGKWVLVTQPIAPR